MILHLLLLITAQVPGERTQESSRKLCWRALHIMGRHLGGLYCLLLGAVLLLPDLASAAVSRLPLYLENAQLDPNQARAARNIAVCPRCTPEPILCVVRATRLSQRHTRNLLARSWRCTLLAACRTSISICTWTQDILGSLVSSHAYDMDTSILG